MVATPGHLAPISSCPEVPLQARSNHLSFLLQQTPLPPILEKTEARIPGAPELGFHLCMR